MDQEHLLWITISLYYYFYLVYCLVVDKRLIRSIKRENFHLVDQFLHFPDDSQLKRGLNHCLFYFTLPVYLFLNRLRYYKARTEDGKRIHKHDFLYRYSVYFTFPLIITRLLVYLAQDDTNEVLNTVANLYYTLVYRIPYFRVLCSLFVVYLCIFVTYYIDKKISRFYFVSYLVAIIISLTFILRTLIGFYFYFLESVPNGLKIFSFYYGTLLALEKFLAWVILYIGRRDYGNRLKRYCSYHKKRLRNHQIGSSFRSFKANINRICSPLKYRFGLTMVAMMTSIDFSRFFTSFARRSLVYDMRYFLANFILYPTLFFVLPLFFVYIFPTNSSDSPIGSYLLTRNLPRHTIYYTTPSLKIYELGKKMLYQNQLFLLESRWIDKYGVHFLQYCSVETGKSYYFTWQPHTNLLQLNGEEPKVFIRDGTKDYIRNLLNESITNLDGTGFEKPERKVKEAPLIMKKRYRNKLYKGLK